MWTTQWYKVTPPPCPHEIQINLGKSYSIDSFSYLPRQDGGTNGTIANYEFYISSDGVNWGTAVSAGTFANNTKVKTVSLAARSGQYIRLRALSEVNGGPWTSAAQITLTGTSVTTGTYSITASAGTGGAISPAGPTTVNSGGSQTYSVTANTGYTISGVTVDGASVGALSSYTFSNVIANHSIAATFSVTGTSGNIPPTGWTLKYADSQELVGQNGAATNAFDGQPGSVWLMWTTQWYNVTPPPCPHEIQINLGKSYSIDSFSYLPRQDGGTNGTIGQYEFYVSSDGINWGTAVATGTFANTTQVKTVSLTAKSGQYIRLRALSEVNGGPWTSAAQISVTGK